ncbi:DUF3895 domain-containing protein [Neobacillus pocheonensis]|uniref:DUF3895 domain-containing protein n=1 Tax=Neobacillus pocheonensis TaxID=363869 RepID=UPI003D27143F
MERKNMPECGGIVLKLTEAQRDLILSSLNEEQVRFLKDEMKRGRRTVFANVIASQKGLRVPEGATFEDIEHLVDSWILVGYVDAGRVTSDLKCECGRSLRYQYHVINKQTGEERKFGIDHLELHTGIDAKTVSEIRSGFSMIDLELDEILLKIEAGWSIDKLSLPPFSDIKLPQDIQLHIDLQLPLLDRQIARIRKLINEALIGNQPIINTRSDTKPPAAPKKSKNKEVDLFTTFEQNQVENDAQNGLTYGQEKAILTYLQSGIQSARIICEMMIKDGYAREIRFVTNKPKFYVEVCWFIESFIPSGQCKLLSADRSDRTYQWI